MDYEILREQGWDNLTAETEAPTTAAEAMGVDAADLCSRCSLLHHDCECFKVWADQITITAGRFEDR